MSIKTIISLLTILAVPGACAFAQFTSTPARSALNARNIKQVLVRRLSEVSAGFSVRVPTHVLKEGYVYLRPVTMPLSITPANRSLFSKAEANSHSYPLRSLAIDFVSRPVKSELDRAFYEDQSTLARDLNAFYEGKSPIYRGLDGHVVQLYALPVDGLLYKPVGYQVPVVLNSNDYFVIYDVKNKTGHIADNTPEVYNLFKPYVDEAIWSAMGEEKVFDDLNNLCDVIMMAYLHKAYVKQHGAYTDITHVVTSRRAEVFKQLSNPNAYVPYLKKLPVVQQVPNGFKAYVVELPVDGLTWVERDGTQHVYNTKDDVMLFFELGAVGVFPRADVENPQYFTPVTK